MITDFKRLLALSKRNLGNNTKTSLPTIVIESDDWGNIRMPSIKILNELVKEYPNMRNCHYLRNDSISNSEDLLKLYDILNKINIKTGKKVVITANTVVTNPDFERIKDNNFIDYYYETIDATINRYNPHDGFEMWKQIMTSDFIKLQYHGREHVNISRWMSDLNKNLKETMDAFNLGIFGISTSVSSLIRKSYLETYAIDNTSEISYKNHSFEEGAEIFYKLFGYQSKSFIAPNYVWDSNIEKLCSKNGISIIQGSNLKKYNENDPKINGLKRLYRNVYFEPASNKKINWVKKALREIEFAFFLKRPAIICMHRVNFIGRINPQNREDNLAQLSTLLLTIIKKYPNVQFISSDQLK